MESALTIKDVPALSGIPKLVADAAFFLTEQTTYLRPEDRQMLRCAFLFAEEAHRGQTRASGDPYISHPLAVASILTQWRLDAVALAAALLHDVVEDTGITKMELVDHFGASVGDLVDGMSKIDKLEFQNKEEAQAENYRKMLLAMAHDLRVILIKLADRLHNMRTLSSMRLDKQKQIARETSEIYAPIANRIGLNDIYRELDDLSFKYMYPIRYEVLSKALKTARGNRRHVVSKILENICHAFDMSGIEALISGREKNLASIHRKMQEKHLSFSEVLDIYGFRVVVKSVETCYLSLSVLHGLYKPIPGRFKDYIAIPKANGYQSLHTALFGPYGTPIEVQIRTPTMHRVADMGVASHWMYKSGDGTTFSDVQQKTHQWLQSLLEIKTESGDALEFLEHIKLDLFPEQVYVFTPKGKILNMPRDASCVDFAYAVHSDIGNHCVTARINHEFVPLRTRLKNGDQVQIITAVHASPSPSWLTFVTTGKARSHIRHFLKTLRFEESVFLGKRLLEQALVSMEYTEPLSDDIWEKYLVSVGEQSRETILAGIGLGQRLAVVVAKRLLQLVGHWTEQQPSGERTAITVRGVEGMTIQFASCCHPIPGDPILGFVKKNHGLVIHTHDCPSLTKRRKTDTSKIIDVEWDAAVSGLFEINLRVTSENVRGAVARITAAIAEAGANLSGVTMPDQIDPKEEGIVAIQFKLQVGNRVHLAHVIRNIRHLPNIYQITRIRG